MNGSFVKIKTLNESAYVNVVAINSIEKAGESVIIRTDNSDFYDVLEVNNMPCDSIDDVANELNLFDVD